jgi:hypothetical protein
MYDMSTPFSVFNRLRITNPREFYSLPVQHRMRYAQRDQGLAFFDHPLLREELEHEPA